MSIEQNVKHILSELPEGVKLVAAAKTRSVEEMLEAVKAGVYAIGHNYIKEAAAAYDSIGGTAKWHCIGHLQRNKVKKAVRIFDMIETVDSSELAEFINAECAGHNKKMDILIEINSACEVSKNGVMPEDVLQLADKIVLHNNLRLKGVMTMGPLFDDPAQIRPFFRIAGDIFNVLKRRYEGIDELSMGMSDSYKIAVEEGATMVRIGTALFGRRNICKII